MNSDIRNGIIGTAKRLGMSPVDLGAIISYETAGTFNPAKPGPVTQWGQHKGLIQFGEPQAKKYGVDWNDPVGSQLKEGGAVERYFRDAGYKPGMGLLDAYSAVNAGSVGRYNASDAKNGGAPGTVRDKVQKQFGPHVAKARKFLEQAETLGSMPEAAPVAFDPAQAGALGFGGADQKALLMAAALGMSPQQMPTRKTKQIDSLMALASDASPASPMEALARGVAGVVGGVLDRRDQEQMNAYFGKQQEAYKKAAESGDLSGLLAVNPDLAQTYAAGALKDKLNPEKPNIQKFGNQIGVIDQNGNFTPTYTAPEDPSQALDMEYKRAQIARMNAPGGGEPDPNAVREWKYYQSLPPEKQREYQALKRSQQTLDLGTGFGVMDGTRPGQVNEVIPKDIAGEAAQREIGQAQGQRQASASGDVQVAQNALDLIESLRNDPNRTMGTGVSAMGNFIPGTPGYDFSTKVEQAKSGAFLTAIQQLKGMGQLSNTEGQTATSAITRMDTATSEEAFLEALTDYEKVVRQAQERAQRNLPGQQAAPNPADRFKKYNLEP